MERPGRAGAADAIGWCGSRMDAQLHAAHGWYEGAVERAIAAAGRDEVMGGADPGNGPESANSSVARPRPPRSRRSHPRRKLKAKAAAARPVAEAEAREAESPPAAAPASQPSLPAIADVLADTADAADELSLRRRLRDRPRAGDEPGAGLLRTVAADLSGAGSGRERLSTAEEARAVRAAWAGWSVGELQRRGVRPFGWHAQERPPGRQSQPGSPGRDSAPPARPGGAESARPASAAAPSLVRLSPPRRPRSVVGAPSAAVTARPPAGLDATMRSEPGGRSRGRAERSSWQSRATDRQSRAEPPAGGRAGSGGSASSGRGSRGSGPGPRSDGGERPVGFAPRAGSVASAGGSSGPGARVPALPLTGPAAAWTGGALRRTAPSRGRGGGGGGLGFSATEALALERGRRGPTPRRGADADVDSSAVMAGGRRALRRGDGALPSALHRTLLY